MKKVGLAAALLGIVCLLASPAQAQVKGVYWAASGTFGPFPISELIPSLPKEKAKDVLLPANMFIIQHANGVALFDTGNNVAISDGKCKSYWSAFWCDLLKPSQKREDVIDAQLKKVGLSPDQVKVVITSHSHLDHIGNIKLFPKAVHVLQKKELYQAWWPENMDRYTAGINYSVKDYNASIQHLKMIRDLENADLYYGHDMDQYKQGGNKWHR